VYVANRIHSLEKFVQEDIMESTTNPSGPSSTTGKVSRCSAREIPCTWHTV